VTIFLHGLGIHDKVDVIALRGIPLQPITRVQLPSTIDTVHRQRQMIIMQQAGR
jgi:hypothetical protein